jgi:hypothetical protein
MNNKKATYSDPISIRIEQKYLDWIDKISADTDRSRSYIFNAFLRELWDKQSPAKTSTN